MSGPGPLGLYVHIPFCEVKCAYCHFAIDPSKPDEAREERYTRALLAEMESRAGGRADTLYFGGGTPSLLSLSRLGRLVSRARELFSLGEEAEVTLEANPRDLDGGALRRAMELGVNRLSLGVQSLDDVVLREMGRPHSAADAREAVSRAHAAGFTSVSVDLILGWPGETEARFGATLDGVLSLGPSHVSLYLLEVSGKTYLQHLARQGRLHLPEEDLVADLYLSAVERLEAQGLRRYEISNFAAPGFESRHNAKYWNDEPFLGFGMAAHSYLPPRRFWNPETFATYLSEPGGIPAGRERVLTPRARGAEAAFTGLRRREGIDLPTFAARYGIDPLEEWAESLRRPFDSGLLEVRGSQLRLTEKGVLLSNEVFEAFV